MFTCTPRSGTKRSPACSEVKVQEQHLPRKSRALLVVLASILFFLDIKLRSTLICGTSSDVPGLPQGEQAYSVLGILAIPVSCCGFRPAMAGSFAFRHRLRWAVHCRRVLVRETLRASACAERSEEGVKVWSLRKGVPPGCTVKMRFLFTGVGGCSRLARCVVADATK